MDEPELEFEGEEEGEDAKASVQKLRERLKKCQQEKQEYLDGWQRAQADFVNTRKRAETERQEFAAFATRSLLSELIPVLDSFDMAFADKEAWNKTPELWRNGIEQIYAKLRSIVEAHGVSTLDPLGEPFDPREHLAVASVPVSDAAQEQTVAEVVQKGYRLHDKILRPAHVKVGEYQKEA